jgi:transposase
MDQRESMLQLALADLESGKYTSIRQAAKAYNVPRSTLADRQHGKPPRSAAHEQQQRLTPAQEEFLTEWILEQDLQGLAPSHEWRCRTAWQGLSIKIYTTQSPRQISCWPTHGGRASQWGTAKADSRVL